MSLWAIKNDECKYQTKCAGDLWRELGDDTEVYGEKFDAMEDAREFGGHVVELAEKSAPIVVSEAEAEMLKRLKIRDEYPAEIIHRYVYDSQNFSEWDYDREIRLMRAYVNDYTVAKEKNYNVKVPHVQAQGGLWFYINSDDKLDATYSQELAKKFTMDEIERYGLQDCEKEEATDDEQ